jgi:hypothetical protein
MDFQNTRIFLQISQIRFILLEDLATLIKGESKKCVYAMKCKGMHAHQIICMTIVFILK